MFHVMFSGKIVGCKGLDFNKTDASDLEVEVVEKVFVGGQIHDRNWVLRAPRHKENWVKRQMDKGYTVVLVVSQVNGMVSLDKLTPNTVHAMGTLLEVLPL